MIRIFNQYVSPRGLLLLIVESVLMTLGLVVGVWLRFWNSPWEFTAYVNLPQFPLQVLIFVAIFEICFYYADLYSRNTIRNRTEQLFRMGQSLGAGCMILGLLYFIFPDLTIGRGVFFISMGLSVAMLGVSRVALDRAWRLAAPKQSIVILGAKETAITVARELNRRDDLNVQVIGFVPGSAEECQATSLFGHPILGPASELESIVMKNRVARIVVALENRRGTLPTAALVKLRVQGIGVEDAHSTISSLTGRVWLNTVQPSWFVFSDGFYRSKATLILKRAIDLFFGTLGLLLSLPVMLMVAAAVRLDSRGPIIFRQTRVGYKGKCFDLLKFRSMYVDAEKENGAQWAKSDDPRITRVGKLIRKFRLDELPQFINVIRGNMSFVGPRPERPFFVDQLRTQIPYYDERHSVRPGLTGWAQVQCGYGASVEDAIRKLEYDLFYLKNMSVLFDCAITFQTIRTVVAGNGAR